MGREVEEMVLGEGVEVGVLLEGPRLKYICWVNPSLRRKPYDLNQQEPFACHIGINNQSSVSKTPVLKFVLTCFL